MEAVVEKCGRPDEDTGRDAYAFLYHLPDGGTVTVTTPRLNSIQTVTYSDSAGGTPILNAAQQKDLSARARAANAR